MKSLLLTFLLAACYDGGADPYQCGQAAQLCLAAQEAGRCERSGRGCRFMATQCRHTDFSRDAGCLGRP